MCEIVGVVSDWQVMQNNKCNRTVSTRRQLFPHHQSYCFQKLNCTTWSTIIPDDRWGPFCLRETMICSFSIANYIFNGGFILQGKAITKKYGHLSWFIYFSILCYQFLFQTRMGVQDPHFFRAADSINLMAQYYKTAMGLCQRYLLVFTLIITLVLARWVWFLRHPITVGTMKLPFRIAESTSVYLQHDNINPSLT